MTRSFPSATLNFVQLDRSGTTPLHRQIYREVRAGILRRQLTPGMRLPATRELALELNVSRNTVLTAVEQLIAEGYLESQVGSGTFVARGLPDLPPAVQNRPIRHTAPVQLPDLLTEPLPKAFSCGVPDLREFPLAIWERTRKRVLSHHGATLLQYAHPQGFAPLRRTLSQYLAESRGVVCDENRILITSGVTQAFDLIARHLIAPGVCAWVEEPGFLQARWTLQGLGALIVPVPVDAEGITIDRSLPTPKLIYVTPSHQYPLGVTMSLRRRLELLQFAREHKAWIIEDDYDSEFRYVGRPISALQGLDSGERVLYLGTFSKTLGPGLRLGYAVLPEALVEELVLLHTAVLRQCPQLDQAVVSEFMLDGHYDRHLKRMRHLYSARYEALENALKPVSDLLALVPCESGMKAIGYLLQGVDEESLEIKARQHGVEVWPLQPFYLRRSPRPGLLLGFSTFTQSEIRQGARHLEKALRSVLLSKAG